MQILITSPFILTGINLDILELIKGESNLLLSFIMIIVAIQAWSRFVKQTENKNTMLEKANIELELANKMIVQSVDHMKSLYQTANILTNQGNKELLDPLEEHIVEYLNNILEIKEPKEILLHNSNYILMTVKVSHVVYGILGIEVNSDKGDLAYKNEIYQLKFLSELIGAAFERLSLGEVNNILLI